VAGQSQRLDIELSDSVTSSTLGELPAYFELLSKRPPPPEGPAPRTPDGKPDLSGIWMTPASYLAASLSQQVDLQPWAEAVVRERVLNKFRDKPSARCLPDNEATEVFVGLFPVKIVQTRNLLVAQWSLPGWDIRSANGTETRWAWTLSGSMTSHGSLLGRRTPRSCA
jgi:hypothetical protein